MELREQLEFAYKCFIAVGIIIPAISLVVSGLDALIPSIDLFDFDSDGVTDSSSIFNISCLMMSLVVVGALGLCLDNYLNPIVSLIISFIFGVIAYGLTLKFIVLPLKSNKADAETIHDFKHKVGTVTVTIPVNGTGEIEVDSKIGKISYQAKANTSDFETEPIPKGTKVLVTGSDTGYLIVTRFF